MIEHRRSWRVGLESTCHFSVRCRGQEELARVVDLSPEGARLHFPSAETAPTADEELTVIAHDGSPHVARARWVKPAKDGAFVGIELAAPDEPGYRLYLIAEHDPVPAGQKSTLEMLLAVSNGALDPSTSPADERLNRKFDSHVIDSWANAGFDASFSALTTDDHHRLLGFVGDADGTPTRLLVDAHRTARAERKQAVSLVRMLVGVRVPDNHHQAIAAVRTAAGGTGWTVAPEAAVWTLRDGDYAALVQWVNASRGP